jgi:hypothetical protein
MSALVVVRLGDPLRLPVVVLHFLVMSAGVARLRLVRGIRLHRVVVAAAVGLRGALGVLVGHGVVVEAEGGNGWLI